jgi:hypothetical protein
MAFYHPRTGTDATPSVDYARVLEATSREVRRIVSAEDEAPIMPEGVTTLHDLLFQVLLNPAIPVPQILSLRASSTTRSLPPQTFEGMWKIVFALGLVPGYEGVQLYRGKVEEAIHPVQRTDILRVLADPKLGNIKTSSLGGASDITLGLHEAPVQTGCAVATSTPAKKMYFFCSSKFYRADETKTVDAYDVANIIAAANHAGFTDDTFRIVLLVKNKEAVKGKFASAYRRYLTYIVQPDGTRDGVLGREDLEAAVIRLRERVGGRPDPAQFIQSVLLGTKEPRFLSLRFHQELIVKKTDEIYAGGKGKYSSVLWGVVARGGKTYMCGGLIRDLSPKHVFIVAGAYTETHMQFLNDLLDARKDGFQDFDDYTAVNVRDDDFAFDAAKKYIFFISAELLKAFVDGKTGKKARERKVMTLVQERKIVPDIVFFDEVHKGGTTSLADDAMSLIAGSAFKVFMTATYNKLFIKDEYGLTQDNFLTWGYEDIQLAKGMDSTETVEAFGKKYGVDSVTTVLASQLARGVSAADIARQYQAFPELQFLTTTFSAAFRDSMQKQNILDPAAGFRMNTLLATGEGCMDTPLSTRYRCFQNPASVAVLLNYIAPHTAQLNTVDGVRVLSAATPSESIMTRIGRTSQRRGDILKNVHTEFRPHSQLWFLPQPVGSSDDKPLLSRMTALASLLMLHPWFSAHMWVVAVSSGFTRTESMETPGGGRIVTTNGGSNTKEIILKLETEARAPPRSRGLIILAGKMLTLGVSLPCVNVVALLDDSQSADLTYQKMFRALTESEGKRIGYVVDVNPVRTLKTLYDYTKVEHDASEVLDDRVDATVLTNLYLIDEDQLFVLDKETRVGPAELNKAIETYLMAGRKSYKSIVEEASVKLATIDLQTELTALHNDLHAVKPEAFEVASRLADVPSGLEIITPEPAPAPAPAPKKERDETKEKLLALREMILTTMTLLAFLTTTTTFQEALEYYRTDTDNIQDIVHSVLVDRGLTTALAKERVKATLLTAIAKVQTQLAQPYGKMRAKLSELSGDQKDVVEFIEQNLRPKKEQVASRGEVFTPITFVEDMLNHLPDEVWTHPEYKWLDPSNGIGNFPVVAFTKLDAALRTVPGYEDEAVRRKHIVENMLYMVELDETNVRLSLNLLQKMCGQAGCRFNILKQDFLVGDLRAAFGVDGFDVCMANPPYNPPKTDTGASGNAIWPHFVMKMEHLLKDGGYLVAVHPPGWKKPVTTEYDPKKFSDGSFKHYDAKEKKWKMKEVQQGQVWQFLKTRGAFTYLYTNDMLRSKLESLPNFPAVDYYVFHKGGREETCAVRNIFRGKEYVATDVRLSTTLPYLPCLITPETIAVVTALVEKEGPKPKFQRFRASSGFSPVEIPEATKYIYTFNRKGEPKYQYSTLVDSNVTSDKVVLNFDGGVDSYTVKFIPKEENVGSYDKTMYTLVSSPEEGEHIRAFFSTDLVKFLFFITQYAYGQRTQNEILVANSVTIPPPEVPDLYAFFGVTEFAPFVRTALAPPPPTAVKTTPRAKKSPQSTVRNRVKK